MDVLDLVIVGVVVFAMVGGYRLGFLGRAASWIGLAVGFYVAIRVLPTVLNHLTTATPTTLLVLTVVIIVAGAMIGQAAGLIAGAHLHRFLPIGPLRLVDRILGSLVGGAGILVVVWLLVPAVAQVAGWPARAVTESVISRVVSRDLPHPPGALDFLRRLVANGNPVVFSVLQGNTASGPPPANSPIPQALAAQVQASTVRVTGQACDEIIEGSGFAVAPDLIVTNAHVVAGEHAGKTMVDLPDGTTRAATVVMYDPNRDLALLSVPGLGQNPLPLASATPSELGAVFGHPEGDPKVVITPAEVSREENATGPDIYGNHDVRRAILVLAATLAHGDSGGALVDENGQVIGVAFAISAESSGTAYALDTSELKAALQEPRQASASTGACLTSG